ARLLPPSPLPWPPVFVVQVRRLLVFVVPFVLLALSRYIVVTPPGRVHERGKALLVARRRRPAVRRAWLPAKSLLSIRPPPPFPLPRASLALARVALSLLS